MAELLATFLVLVLNARRVGKIGAEVMAGARLQRLAILHHRLDAPGLHRTGKALVLGLFASDHRQRQVILGAGAVHFQRAVRFGQRIGAVGMGGMAFLPQEFGGAQEHTGAHFPTDHVGPLVGQ